MTGLARNAILMAMVASLVGNLICLCICIVILIPPSLQLDMWQIEHQNMETARHHICIYHVILVGLGQELHLHLRLQCTFCHEIIAYRNSIYIYIYGHNLNQWAKTRSHFQFCPNFIVKHDPEKKKKTHTHTLGAGFFFTFQCFVFFLIFAFSCPSFYLSLCFLTFWSLKVAHRMRL